VKRELLPFLGSNIGRPASCQSQCGLVRRKERGTLGKETVHHVSFDLSFGNGAYVCCGFYDVLSVTKTVSSNDGLIIE
jgi:hypothetical protein